MATTFSAANENTSRLVRVSPLLPGESLPSLLYRLAVLNRYEHSPFQVMRLCRGRLSRFDNLAQPTRAETYQVLAELVGIEAGALYDASVYRFAPTITPPGYEPVSITLPSGQTAAILGNSVLREYTRPTFDVQFCPLCLKEAAYHRLAWLPLAAAACLKHQCLLVHRCPKCQKNLNVLDIMERRCPHCDFELIEAPVISVAADTFGLLSQTVIQGWLGTSPLPRLDGLPVQSTAALYRLLDGLRRAAQIVKKWDYLHQTPADIGSSHFHCTSKTALIPAKSFVLYATAFKGLLNWPRGFYDFLDAYKHRDGRQEGGQIAQDFGILYNGWLERRWQFPALRFAQETFDQYLLDNYTLTPSMIHLPRVWRNPKLLAKIPYVTEAEAARLLGTTPVMIKRLVELGFLVSYQQAEVDAPPQYFNLVRRAEVEALQQRWQGAIPLREAAQLLGISEVVTVDLIKEGLLEAVRGPNADKTAAWKLSYQSITDFTARLRKSVAQYPAKQPAQPVDLVGAAQMLSSYGFNLVRVLKLVLTGELRGYWAGEAIRLHHLVISRRDIETVMEGIRSNRPLVTRQQVANMLKVKIPIITAWVKRGLLVPVKEDRQVMYFDRESVRSFIDNHVFVEEAAKILGIDELVVQKWARNGRIRSVSGPGVDDLHRYLFRREDVERLKPENRLTGPQLARLLGLSRAQLWVWIKQGKVKPVSGPGLDGSKHYLFERPAEVVTELQVQ